MIIKVCGMRDSRNIQEVSALAVNWIGLIFYERSPRFIGKARRSSGTVDSGQLTVKYRLSQLSTVNCQLSTKKVGVFVNATIESMMETASAYKLDYLQLHGNESPEDCHTLQKRGYSLIKTFPGSPPKRISRRPRSMRAGWIISFSIRDARAMEAQANVSIGPS